MFGKGKVELLEQKTLDELGVATSQLSAGSHTKVYVKCMRCSEEYKREFRNLHQLHNCPTYRTIGDVRHKWCNKCKLFKATTQFYANAVRHDGFSSQCISCTQDKGSTFDGWIQSLFTKKRNECKKRDIPFDITTDFLIDQWHVQDGFCFYSKMKLNFNSTALVGAQLDRIVPSKGYTIGNVVWTSKAINNLKNNAPLDEFRDFLSEAIFDVPVRCEFIKLDPNAKMPEKKRATDAGLDVYAVENNTIEPHSVKTIRTGLAMVVPPGYYYTIEGRSGFWKHGIMPCRGIIDATYSGEVMIAVHNFSDKQFEIKAGDRFAQVIIHRLIQADIIEVEKIDDTYIDRGSAGHGSTGIN